MAKKTTATTVYAATFIEKEVQVFDPEEGASGDITCTMSDSINVEAPNLAALMDTLRRRYALDLDDLFIPGEEDEPITSFGYNQLEDDDGNEVDNEPELAQWKRGEIKLWLADYTFGVEKRVVSPLSLEEFQATDIPTH